LVGKPEGKRLLGRPRCRWVDSIKMELRGLGWGGVDWNYLAQDRDQWRALVNMVMNLRVPWHFGNFLSSCIIGGFSRRAQPHEVIQYACIIVYNETNVTHVPFQWRRQHYHIMWNKIFYNIFSQPIGRILYLALNCM
jgi:hypothetical protein